MFLGAGSKSRVSHLLVKHFTNSATFPAPLCQFYCLNIMPYKTLTLEISMPPIHPRLLCILNLTQLGVTSEERVSAQLSSVSAQLSLWPLSSASAQPVAIVLTADQCGRGQPTVGGSTPRQLVLNYKRMLAEHKPEQREPQPADSFPL